MNWKQIDEVLNETDESTRYGDYENVLVLSKDGFGFFYYSLMTLGHLQWSLLPETKLKFKDVEKSKMYRESISYTILDNYNIIKKPE